MGIALMIVIVVVAYIVFMTGPTIPDHAKIAIDSIVDAEVPEFVKGDTGYVVSDDYHIWYESITPVDSVKGTVLLFMGISNDALGWPQDFLDNLVRSGYRTIRFDYRGTGLSDWRNGHEDRPWSLRDLAHDAVIILDSLTIEKAHLLGISLGGMVAQEYAINYPERALTLTSVMSSGYITDPDLPPVNKAFVVDLVKNSVRYSIIHSEKNILRRNVAVRMLLRGDALYDIDVEGVSMQVLYNIRNRKGYNPGVSRQQQKATFLSGSRYEELEEITVPALIIHGMNDPFIPIEHSMKLAEIIPGAEAMWVDNMGHDVPPYLIDSLTRTLVKHFSSR